MTATTSSDSRIALQNEFNQIGSRLVRFGQAMQEPSTTVSELNRYRLFKTDNYGRDKLGWIQVGSVAGQELVALDTDQARFEACEKLF